MTILETTAAILKNLQYSIFDYDAWQPKGQLLSTFRQAVESFLEAEMEAGLLMPFWQVYDLNTPYPPVHQVEKRARSLSEPQIQGCFIKHLVEKFSNYQVDTQVQFFDKVHFTIDEFQKRYDENPKDKTVDIVIAETLNLHQKLICQKFETPFLVCELKVEMAVQIQNPAPSLRIKNDINKLKHIKEIFKDQVTAILLYIEIPQEIGKLPVVQILEIH